MRNPLYRSLSGMHLLILISIPTFVPSLHELLHYHQHLHCTASPSDVHLHANTYDCQLCDYLTTLTYLCESSVATTADVESCIVEFFPWDNPDVSSHSGTYNPRGPPVESV